MLHFLEDYIFSNNCSLKTVVFSLCKGCLFSYYRNFVTFKVNYSVNLYNSLFFFNFGNIHQSGYFTPRLFIFEFFVTGLTH